MVEGLTPVPPAREYPEFTEDGIRELWMGLDVKELTWESFHRAAIRSMPHEERDKIVGLFKDKGGEYKSRRPTMVEFIEVVLSIDGSDGGSLIDKMNSRCLYGTWRTGLSSPSC
eukprot:TRINITY_DN8392_c0_g1_i2.p1 TRINITY_DN8392_c0_g1~~TRINITY_DN8392_c0_g1_i2.p1  ORF type:complete len:114 (-),score=20.04 TRINITY_DN8392_c0_g1_i2:148-489(-)